MRTRLLLLLVVLTGCSAGSDSVATSPEPSDAATRLEVRVVADEGADPQTWTLTCAPTGGDHPDPAGACDDLADEQMPFAPLPADGVCTQLYGGPQTATVRGTYQGQAVSLELSRTDGCRVAQWDRLGAVLPAGAVS